jgi:hypothetical protein
VAIAPRIAAATLVVHPVYGATLGLLTDRKGKRLAPELQAPEANGAKLPTRTRA